MPANDIGASSLTRAVACGKLFIMPLYEFTCQRCRHLFEALVRPGDTPECPACGEHELERMLSLFAVASDTTRNGALQGARRRNRKIQRDKAIAEHEERHHHH
jgi:putative FmdB family regulatory protein